MHIAFSKNGLRPVIAVILALAIVGVFSPNATGQTSEPMSRAEQEAEQQVSLSPEKIIEVLRDEPGLLLQLKKLLVRQAFADGRILNASDLNDDALFRLLWEDENARVLATREIEDRDYIRAKPTHEEIERERDLAAQRGLSRTSMPELFSEQPTAETNRPVDGQQEGAYWNKREQDLQTNQRLHDRRAEPNILQPEPSSPDVQPNIPQRQLNRASSRQIPDDYADDGYTDIEGRGQSHATRPSFANSAFTRSSSATPDFSSLNFAGQATATQELPDLRGGSSSLQSRSLGTRSGSDALTGNGGFLNDSDEADSSQSPQSYRAGRSVNALDARLDNSWRKLSPREFGNSNGNNDESRSIIRHQPNPYANVPSLYDLYTQVSRKSSVPERFGMEIFRNGTGNLDNLPMDLPVGPEYVLGPGDGLNIELWGGVAQRLQRVIDREGRVALPEVGSIAVSGRPLGEAQRIVQSVLRTQFHDVEADVSLARIRSVRVYVVGDVVSPGAYDISSLSSPLNALYAAGGPTNRGSLRHLQQFRGKTLVQTIDVYDLLLHGIHTEIARIESGDTILVPSVGPQVTVQGMVRRPAIYELGSETSLAEILELAGGVLASGTLRHIDVERVVAHENRTMLRLDLPENNDQKQVDKALNEFNVQDGDSIKISPILPYAEKTVFLDGHVFRPGKYPYREGMKVTDLLHSYSDLMPEPATAHAEIIRLQAPDYTPVVLAFNLTEALDGKEQNLVLKPFDTVRVFGRYDFEDPPVVTVTGEVRFPGDHLTNGRIRLRDAVYMAGGVGPDAELTNAQIFRKVGDGKLKVISINLSKALDGEAANNVWIEPKDRVFIHRSTLKVDPSAVLIQGEVTRPGKYPLGQSMTASELVRLAGGLTRGADLGTADLARYLSSDGSNAGEHQFIEIAKAVAGENNTDVPLRDGDVLTIRQRPGWNDMGSVVSVKGEVVHPGSYGIQEGERLSSILARAGGFRSDAYPYGAILERVQVREVEEKNRVDLIRHVQAEGASLKLIPETDDDQKMAKQASLLQWQSALDKLQNTPPAGRLVIHISQDIKHWENTAADVEIRKGDVLIIPKTSNFVMVDGSVYNPTAVSFKPGKSAAWYLRQAGGPNNVAEKKSIFLIRADGSVVGGNGGLWSGGPLTAELRPGDMLVVPEKAYSGTTRWKSTLQSAQLVSAVGIAVQVARAF